MSRVSELSIPYNYYPRAYQKPFWQAMGPGGKRRAVVVWHRRSGKDKTLLNFTIDQMLSERVGTYYYFFPTYSQGKKILWDGVDKDGFPFLSHFPASMVESRNETEMQIKTINGSVFQIIGTDNFDSIVGTNPVGCIFSEFALQDPSAWDLTRPILRENGGWAVFGYTPRGQNHAYDLYEMAKDNPDWFCQLLTVEQTFLDNGQRVFTEAMIEAERREGMPEETIQQEYYCSFSAGNVGTYYSKLLEQAEAENRITDVPYTPALPVETWWDLGVGDSTAIWFVQAFRGREFRFIDFYENHGVGLTYYAKVVRDRPYVYSEHIAPHDINVREFTTGVSRIEVARDLGLHFEIAPKLLLAEGIDAARRILPLSWFDKEKCKRGLKALKAYRKAFDERKKVYMNTPVHDWASHPADAYRTGALKQDPSAAVGRTSSLPPRSNSYFDVFNYDRPQPGVQDFDVFNYDR